MAQEINCGHIQGVLLGDGSETGVLAEEGQIEGVALQVDLVDHVGAFDEVYLGDAEGTGSGSHVIDYRQQISKQQERNHYLMRCCG